MHSDLLTTEPNDSLPSLRPPTSGFEPESFVFKQQNPPEADRSNYFIILRFLVLLFDLPAIASRLAQARRAGIQCFEKSVLCRLSSGL
jgi:hypothetical protein